MVCDREKLYYAGELDLPTVQLVDGLSFWNLSQLHSIANISVIEPYVYLNELEDVIAVMNLPRMLLRGPSFTPCRLLHKKSLIYFDIHIGLSDRVSGGQMFL